MDWRPFSIRELVGAAHRPVLEVKYGPVGPPAPLPRAQTLFLADDRHAYLLQNDEVGGDVYVPETGEYTDMIGATVLLQGARDLFDAIPVGPRSTHRIDSQHFRIGWCECPIEQLMWEGEPARFAIRGASIHIENFEGSSFELLTELNLSGPSGRWRLKLSGQFPGAFQFTSQNDEVL